MRITPILLLFSFLLALQLPAQEFQHPKPWTKYSGEKLKKKQAPRAWHSYKSFQTGAIPDRIDTTPYPYILSIWKYDSLYHDSTWQCTVWFNDKKTPVTKAGKCWETIPLQSMIEAYAGNDLNTLSKGRTCVESFYPMGCEVGGNSGYNKYIFHFNNSGWPDTIQHFKAWYTNEEGPVDYNLTPSYFLGERAVIRYEKNKEVTETYREITEVNTVSTKLVERITHTFDDNGRLLSEERFTPSVFGQKEERMRIWYYYAKP